VVDSEQIFSAKSTALRQKMGAPSIARRDFAELRQPADQEIGVPVLQRFQRMPAARISFAVVVLSTNYSIKSVGDG
jgi:hypothetical protein